MANLKDVIYLSNEDYATLVSTGTVTIGDTTLTYDENNLYITPDSTYHLSSGSSGTIKYLEDVTYTAPSGTPTTRYLGASFDGTKTNALVTGVSVNSQGTVSLTGTRTTSGSGASTRRNLSIAGSHSGTTLNVSKGDYTPSGSITLTANESTALDRITYLQSYSVSGGSIDKATKYLTLEEDD